MSDERPMKKAEKHKLSDPLDDVAWKIMRKMGYEHGQGLGVNAHGVVEPVVMMIILQLMEIIPCRGQWKANVLLIPYRI
uniref:G-patch domain-containing protein n=1 Tax=Schistosoma mansoni TaxID=6183 RepID=A0AA82N7X1_SCHMA